MESVLRYGLPPRVSYSLIKPGRHEEKVRKALNMLYTHLLDKDKKDMVSKPEEGAGMCLCLCLCLCVCLSVCVCLCLCLYDMALEYSYYKWMYSLSNKHTCVCLF